MVHPTGLLQFRQIKDLQRLTRSGAPVDFCGVQPPMANPIGGAKLRHHQSIFGPMMRGRPAPPAPTFDFKPIGSPITLPHSRAQGLRGRIAGLGNGGKPGRREDGSVREGKP